MADSVLIIGGETDYQERLRLPFTEAGYEVTLAYDYITARTIIEDLVPDIIIILDEVHQNGMDNFMACKHLNDDYGIPVIVVGKGPNGQMWKKTVGAGGDYYLKSSASSRIFITVTKSILRRYWGRKLKEAV